MECKFVKHGLALSYDQIVKPCCEWKFDQDWAKQNHLDKINLATWHASLPIKQINHMLETNVWPRNCSSCEKFESQGRGDSMRGNGNHAYAHYQENDITLEIRPGSVCNFSCQTCWPAASSRVAQYHHQAGLIDIKSLATQSYDNFDFLLPIVHRIRDVIVLGGEPFYDKSCKKFLEWAKNNLQANIMMFTNGSQIDFDFIESYPGRLTLIFSIDAVGRPAEYIRFGTEWTTVYNNYLKTKTFDNVDVRVNITCSVYNYAHIDQVIDMLCEDWPTVVTFGAPIHSYLLEGAIPLNHRTELIEKLFGAVKRIKDTAIEEGQKHNAINALQSNIANLQLLPWNKQDYDRLVDFVNRMDRVKNVKVKDYCTWLYNMLQQDST